MAQEGKAMSKRNDLHTRKYELNHELKNLFYHLEEASTDTERAEIEQEMSPIYVELANVDAQLQDICPKCEGTGARERHSLDLPAGRHCDPCWETSGYRKEGREGFDPAYAGEVY